MKRCLISLLCAALLLSPVCPVRADFSPETDYMAQMMECARANDLAGGLAAQRARDEKLEALRLPYVSVDFEELWLLSKIIYAEAGCAWLDSRWKMAVGEVVLNRVASPEFPDTIREVLEQPGQYYGKGSRYFERLCPTAECVEAALRLLEGERVLCESAVVFQSNYRLGSGVFLELHDAALGSTYLCLSSHPELYA